MLASLIESVFFIPFPIQSHFSNAIATVSVFFFFPIPVLVFEEKYIRWFSLCWRTHLELV